MCVESPGAGRDNRSNRYVGILDDRYNIMLLVNYVIILGANVVTINLEIFEIFLESNFQNIIICFLNILSLSLSSLSPQCTEAK